MVITIKELANEDTGTYLNILYPPQSNHLVGWVPVVGSQCWLNPADAGCSLDVSPARWNVSTIFSALNGPFVNGLPT